MTIRHRRATKRAIAAVSAAAMAASVFAISTPTSAVPTLDATVRLAGPTRYETAAAIAAQVACSNDIILASGENQPDALAAAALAGSVKAPVLLTPSSSLSAAASNKIGNCAAGSPQTVHILGGEAAISASVADAVDALNNVTVNRIAGSDRYATAAAIANTVTAGAVGSLVGKRTAIVASGTSFVDALAAGPVSYRGVIGGVNAGPHPILLTRADSLPAATDTALTSLNIQQVVIMGGTAVVSDAVEAAITAKGITVIRVAGANRNATAAALAAIATKAAGLGGFGFDGKNIGLANGTNAFGGFDALAAAPYLGEAGAPLLLTGTLPADTQKFLEDNDGVITKLHIFGGLAAVDQATQDAAEAAATQAVPTAVITAEQGRSEFTVVFSEPVLNSTVAIGDFALNNVNLGGVSVTPTDLTGTAPNQVATTYKVVLAGPLVSGDAVRVNANAIGTNETPPRFVATATVTVAPDTAKPVGTILAAVNNGNFRVSFNEPVTPATANVAGNYSATAGTGNPAINVTGAALDATGKVVTVSVSRALLAGDRVNLLGGVVADLATPANFANAAAKTVLADTVAPQFVSATHATTDAATAMLTVDAAGTTGGGAAVATAIRYTSKKLGVDGNAISVQYAAAAGATENVTVATNAITVTPRAGGSTPAQIAAAVNANVFANQLVTAEAITPTSTTTIPGAIGPFPLTGGVTNVVVTATFSEVVFVGDVQAYAGSTVFTPFVGGLCCGATLTEPNGTASVYTIVINNAAARPTANASAVSFTATDLAGNLQTPDPETKPMPAG